LALSAISAKSVGGETGCGVRVNGCGVRWQLSALVAAILSLQGCAGHLFHGSERGDSELNAYPADYKADILAAMHAYLNDPTGIRDAAISPPAMKTIADHPRYIVCLRFDGKQDNGYYAGDKQIAAVFLAGRFDEFTDPVAAKEPCAGAAFAPFPELQNLAR
jgi:hypothetical protein